MAPSSQSTRRRRRRALRGSPRSGARLRAAWEDERQVRREEERDEHEHRRQHERDLQRRVDDHRDREVGRLRAASWTPTTFSTAFPAIATTTRPANSWLMCSVSIAGVSAVTNQSEANAARRPGGRQDHGRRGDRPAGRLVLLPGALRRKPGRVSHEQHEQHAGADERERLSVGGRGSVERDARATGSPWSPPRGTARVAIIRARDESKRCGAVAEAADEEREPEHEHAVCENRADERRLDDLEEAVVQREQRDEELRQVAQRGLDDARAARAEPRAELLRGGADEPREQRERGRCDDERDNGSKPAK